MTKQQIIHHVSQRLEFLLNHSDGKDRNLNADKITELSALLRDITNDDDVSPMPMGNTFTYDQVPSHTLSSSTLRNGILSMDEPVERPTRLPRSRTIRADHEAPSETINVYSNGGTGTIVGSSGIA